MDAITIQNLSKTYATDKKAIADISFSIKEGEIFGFLGPKGASS